MSDLPPVPPEPAPRAPGLPPRSPGPSADPHAAWAGPPERPDLDLPRATWRWWEVVIVYLGAQIVGLIVSTPLIVVLDDDPSPERIGGLVLIVSSIVIDLVLFGVAYLWLQRLHPTWRRIMGFPARDRWSREVAAGFVASLVILFVSGIVGAGIRYLLEAVEDRSIVQPDQIPDDLNAVGLVLTIVFACLIAPIVEEFVFRGLLFRSIRDRYGLLAGVLVSGIIFGGVHFGVDGGGLAENLLLQIPLAVVGIGFALVYEMRKNLIAPIAAHVMFNVIGVIVILGNLS